LASLLKTAENLKVKGLAEVSTTDAGSSGTCLIPTSTPAKVTSMPSSSSSVTDSTSPTFMQAKKPKIEHNMMIPNILPLGMLGLGGLGEPVKRKRGRPRILDAPGEINPFAPAAKMDMVPKMSVASSSSMDLVSSTNNTPKIAELSFDETSNEPTPGGPLTTDRIKDLGIIKMNDYLASGTRQQFWEEYYVRVIMQVSNSFFPNQ
jgi:hypothetical protein